MNYRCPLDEMRSLLIRQRVLEKKYNINKVDICFLNYRIQEQERVFEMQKHNMNEDIKKFDIFILTPAGKLKQIFWLKSTDDYNHYSHNLHHFIEKQHYERNKKWYEERGIKQILILLPVTIHEQLHGIAIKNLTDEEFKARYKISKWALLFNKKYSEY